MKLGGSSDKSKDSAMLIEFTRNVLFLIKEHPRFARAKGMAKFSLSDLRKNDAALRHMKIDLLFKKGGFMFNASKPIKRKSFAGGVFLNVPLGQFN